MMCDNPFHYILQRKMLPAIPPTTNMELRGTLTPLRSSLTTLNNHEQRVKKLAAITPNNPEIPVLRALLKRLTDNTCTLVSSIYDLVCVELLKVRSGISMQDSYLHS